MWTDCGVCMPHSHLKGNFDLLFVVIILYAAKRQISVLFIEIILSQDSRMSFEGRTLLEDELLLEDIVSW